MRMDKELEQSLNEAVTPRWISVKDRLPEVCENVLVYGIDGFVDIGCLGNYGEWEGCESIPTHWMPLPEPPKDTT